MKGTIFGYKPSEIRKALVAFIGFVITVLAVLLGYDGLLPPEVARWVPAIVAIGTIYGVYRVPNAPAGRHEAP